MEAVETRKEIAIAEKVRQRRVREKGIVVGLAFVDKLWTRADSAKSGVGSISEGGPDWPAWMGLSQQWKGKTNSRVDRLPTKTRSTTHNTKDENLRSYSVREDKRQCIYAWPRKETEFQQAVGGNW